MQIAPESIACDPCEWTFAARIPYAVSMKIGIMGAGAIGCYLGGRLMDAGEEVVFVGRPSLGEELARHGLTLTDYDGRSWHFPPSRVDYSPNPARLAGCDAVLLTVKCNDTESAAQAMAPHLKPSAMVVSFQNGVGNAALIERHLPHQTVLAGMVPFNVLRRANGTFHQGTSGALVVEKAAGLETSLAWAFEKSELEVVHHPNMKGVMWGKLIFNLNNALNALAGIPLRDEISDPQWRRVLAACMEEALGVLKAADIQPARFGRMAPTLAPRILKLPNAVFFAVAGAMVKIDPEARSSMWEDLERGRPTEIAFLNGAIVELAKRIGRPTPVNTSIVESIHLAEKQGAGSPRLTPEKLAQRMGLRL